MALRPLNDYAKVRLDDQGTFSAKAGDAATDGILVDLPVELTHFGMYSSIIDDSFMAKEKLGELLMIWREHLNKRVYWLALAEKGAILQEEDGTRYAYIKLSSLMAVSDADELAESVLDKHGGSFSA